MADLNKILTNLKVSRKNEFLPILEKELKKFSDEDIARFLSNVLVESSKFSSLRENLNYSTPERLVQIYPSAFAKPPRGLGYNPYNYIKNPQKLANLIYNSNLIPSKKSLGNFTENSGWLYRGGGLMQTTGYNNYLKLSQLTKIDFIKDPDLISIPEYAVKSAVIFYNSNKLSQKKTLKEVRIAINGSELGYTEVLKVYNQIKSML